MPKLYLITILFIFTNLFSNAYEQLDIDFLKKPPTKKVLPPKPESKKPALPAYKEVIKDMDKIDGLFSLRQKYLLKVKGYNVFLYQNIIMHQKISQ